MRLRMLAIPELDGPSVAFGDIRHMPKYGTIPEEFKRYDGTPYNKAVSSWFFSGARFANNVLTIDGVDFHPKAGVDAGKALRAIKAVLGSFEPKHEEKEAACAYMLSEWFNIEAAKPEKKRAARS